MNSSIYKLTFNRRKHFVLNSSFLLRLTTVLIESAILGIAFSTYFCFCFKVGKKRKLPLGEKSIATQCIWESVTSRCFVLSPFLTFSFTFSLLSTVFLCLFSLFWVQNTSHIFLPVSASVEKLQFLAGTHDVNYACRRSVVGGKIIGSLKDGAYYCYRAYVLRISSYSDFLSPMLTNTGIFLRGLKLSGESRSW